MRRIAATWTDPMATDVCLGATRSRALNALIQNGDWCGIIPALNRNIVVVGSPATRVIFPLLDQEQGGNLYAI